MNTKRHSIVLIAALVAATMILAIGCSKQTCGLDAECSYQFTADKSDPHAKPIMLDDYARMKDLVAKATKLLNESKPPSMDDLRKQLSRTKCKLTLQARRTKPVNRSDIHRQNASGVLIVAGLHKCNKCVKWHSMSPTVTQPP